MKGIFIFLPPIAFALMYIVAMFSFGFDSVKVYAFGLVALLFTSSSNIYNNRYNRGIVGGIIAGIALIYLSTLETGQAINMEIPLGIILIIFYLSSGLYLKKKDDWRA